MKQPFNLFQWIQNNQNLLKPPITNKNLYIESEDYIIMVVGGPNQRQDFHYNESEELFFQLQGDVKLLIQKNGKINEINIKEGELFLLPAKIPHSPIRGVDTVGLVVEMNRSNKELKDALQWYCSNCNALLFEEYFKLKDIERDFLPIFKKFYSSQDFRSCKKCGTILAADKRFV